MKSDLLLVKAHLAPKSIIMGTESVSKLTFLYSEVVVLICVLRCANKLHCVLCKKFNVSGGRFCVEVLNNFLTFLLHTR